MTELPGAREDPAVQALARKVAAFRKTLDEHERQLLDAMLVAAASGETGEVQGYGLMLPGREMALAVLLVLGIGATALAPVTGGTAQAAPVDQQSSISNPVGSLGFTLRDTPVREQLQRSGTGTAPDLAWSAEFTSAWELNEAQLDRWSAQAIGLIADELGGGLRLAGYERLDASGIGDQQVAYRYQLASPSGQPAGEATVVVFARGNRVGMTGTGALGARPSVDATSLARALDAGSPRG